MANIENILSSDNLPQGTLKINDNFTELNLKKIELEGLTTEMLDTDYFTIKKDDGKFYLISKVDADLGGGGGGAVAYGGFIELEAPGSTNTGYTYFADNGDIYILSVGDTINTKVNLTKFNSNLEKQFGVVYSYNPSTGTPGLYTAGYIAGIGTDGYLYLTMTLNTNTLSPVEGSAGATVSVIGINPNTGSVLSIRPLLRDTDIDIGDGRYLSSIYNPYIIMIGDEIYLNLQLELTGVTYIFKYNYMTNVLTNWSDGTVSKLYKSLTTDLIRGTSANNNVYKLSNGTGIAPSAGLNFSLINDGTHYYYSTGSGILKLDANFNHVKRVLNTYLGNKPFFTNSMGLFLKDGYIYNVLHDGSGVIIYIDIYDTLLNFVKTISITPLLSSQYFYTTQSSNILNVDLNYIYLSLGNSISTTKRRIFKIDKNIPVGEYYTNPTNGTNLFKVLVYTTATITNPANGTSTTVASLPMTTSTLNRIGAPSASITDTNSVSFVKTFTINS